jgi:glycerol-3-phosphate O-acyltransferase/dihydroxyacetone phosphate acyltransferase
VAYFPREIYFLVAAASTKNVLLSFFLKLINFIPTRRPQDEAVKGTGVLESLKGNILKGKDTLFTKDVKEKETISISEPRSSFFVIKVIDDQTLQIDNSKNVELDDQMLPYKVVPKLDQSKVFDNSWQLLRDGKVVGIFPEVGKSKLGRLSRSDQPSPDQGWSCHYLYGRN